MELPTLPADKCEHVIGGALAGVAVAAACCFAGYPQFSRIGAIVGAAVAGALKEAWDWYENRTALVRTHDVDPYDFLATVAGGLLVAARQ